MLKIIAGVRIEPNSHTSPFYLNMERLLSIFEIHHKRTIDSEDSASEIVKIYKKDGFLSSYGSYNSYENNSTDQNLWLYQIRVALDCSEQNLIAYPNIQTSSNDFLRHSRNDFCWCHFVATRSIEPGEELTFWPWFGLSILFGIPPYIAPINILNDRCYKCHQCGESYQQPNPLKIHLAFVCAQRNVQSNFSIIKKLEMPTEQRIAAKRSDIKKTADRFCSKRSFNRNPSNRLHTCSYCGKVYTRKYGLKIHIRTHTGSKPLSCSFCGRSFSDPSNLNKHIRLHSQHLDRYSFGSRSQTVIKSGRVKSTHKEKK